MESVAAILSRSRPAFFIVRALGLVVTAALLLVCGWNAEAAGPIRIMPLGDSITYGHQIPGGYRIDLWSRLAGAGHTVNFVGSLADGPVALPDRDHEGHSGYYISDIAANINSWLAANPADVILLMIGTNDINGNNGVPLAPVRLTVLIDKIVAQSPSSRLIVASIPPFANPFKNNAAIKYNAAILGIVNAMIAQGKNVAFADINSLLTLSDLLPDGFHPNTMGYKKIADGWYGALAISLP